MKTKNQNKKIMPSKKIMLFALIIILVMTLMSSVNATEIKQEKTRNANEFTLHLDKLKFFDPDRIKFKKFFKLSDNLDEITLIKQSDIALKRLEKTLMEDPAAWRQIFNTFPDPDITSQAMKNIDEYENAAIGTKKIMKQGIDELSSMPIFKEFKDAPINQLNYIKKETLAGIIALGDASDVKNIDKLAHDIATSENLGSVFHAKRVSLLKHQPNTVVKELEVSFEGINAPQDILYEITQDNKVIKVLEEIKSSNFVGTKIKLNEIRDQMNRLADAVKKGFADKARLVSPQGTIFGQEVKNLAEELNIEVLEGVIPRVS